MSIAPSPPAEPATTGRDVTRAGSAAVDAAGLSDDACLDRLRRAVAAARPLGVDVAEAEAVVVDAEARLGFPSDAAVVALVGGTGVGKSSLLNALAGGEVSTASVRRPTTSTPVAWIPAAAADDLRPVLDWLGVPPADRRIEEGTGSIAILDLPDLDSIEPDHRRRVDEVLPRVDAVIWVTDPEKYHDALLHDEMLARWVPRLGRQLVVVNKADRLRPADAAALRRDLERDLARIASGRSEGRDPATWRPRVVMASALGSAPDGGDGRGAGTVGVTEVRHWLEEAAATKRVARQRISASIRDTLAALARAAGIDPHGPSRGLIAPDDRRATVDRAVEALLRVVDLPAVRRQAVNATRARARARGAGPLGGLTSRLFRWSGREARVADPAAYLARWRDRGTTGSAASIVRASLAEPLRTAPPGIRARLATTASETSLERGLASALDRAIVRDPGQPPASRWWTLIGLAQTVATGALVLTAIWVGLWIVIRFPTDSVVLPLVGSVPAPFVAIVAAVIAGYVLARLLGAHAGHVGRRWADALATRIRDAVRSEIASTAFSAVDRIDADRRALWTAARGAADGCRQA